MKQYFALLLPVILLASCKPANQKAGKDEKKFAAEITVVNNGNIKYDTWFAANTMRVDYFHSGSSKEEHFAVDQVVSDGAWPGSSTTLIDKLELGLYFYEVVDKESKVLLYSRGFSSVFGEWRTTPEADSVWGTFHE